MFIWIANWTRSQERGRGSSGVTPPVLPGRRAGAKPYEWAVKRPGGGGVCTSTGAGYRRGSSIVRRRIPNRIGNAATMMIAAAGSGISTS